MSCITEILKNKGDQPYLINESVLIEGGGQYKDYEYLIIFNDMGFRCGYVAISPNHPIYNTKERYPNLSVHGGVSFFEKQHLIESNCEDKWIGFDAGHLYDKIDDELLKKYFKTRKTDLMIESLKRINDMLMIHHHNLFIRSYDYMEKECQDLIEQLKELEYV